MGWIALAVLLGCLQIAESIECGLKDIAKAIADAKLWRVKE